MSAMDPDDSVSRSVIERVAAAEGIDAVDIDVPLYHAIDPDALDALFERTESETPLEAELTFRYYGYVVVVRGDGSVTLEGGSTPDADTPSSRSSE